jgi:hypothetical protein
VCFADSLLGPPFAQSVAAGHESNAGSRDTETLRTRYNLALLLSMEDETREAAVQLYSEVKQLSQSHHPWWEHVCEEDEAAAAAAKAAGGA